MIDQTAWSIGAHGTLGFALRTCLESAALAPSVHNTQPWRFRVAGDVVDVFADRSRQLTVVDPRGRELLISVGAAIFNLRITMLALGRVPTMVLRPNGYEPDLVARVAPGPRLTAPREAVALAAAVPRRRTNRNPFQDRPVPAATLADLADAARAEECALVVVDEAARDGVLALVRAAEARWRQDPRYWAELDRWSQPGPDRRDGVPPHAYGPWSASADLPIRDFGLVRPTQRGIAQFEPEPTIAVLYSRGDALRDWICAGQALERVLLGATVHGLVATMMSQPMEVPELRALLSSDTDGLRPQVILRLGYGASNPPTPRRPLREVLDGLLPSP